MVEDRLSPKEFVDEYIKANSLMPENNNPIFFTKLAYDDVIEILTNYSRQFKNKK